MNTFISPRSQRLMGPAVTAQSDREAAARLCEQQPDAPLLKTILGLS